MDKLITFGIYAAVFGGAALAVIGFIAVLVGAVSYAAGLGWSLATGGC